jgi:hypothetical protein
MDIASRLRLELLSTEDADDVFGALGLVELKRQLVVEILIAAAAVVVVFIQDFVSLHLLLGGKGEVAFGIGAVDWPLEGLSGFCGFSHGCWS